MKNKDAVAKGLFSVYNREVEKGEAQQVSPHKKIIFRRRTGRHRWKGIRRESMSKRPVVLMILDGYGLNEKTEGNAVAMAKTPVMDRLMKECAAEDIIIIHDAIRPMVSDTIISDSIHTCKKKGMGVAAVTSMDNVMMTDDGVTGRISISRYAFRRIQTPQTYFLGELKKAHEEALEKGIEHENDTNNIISRLGKNVYFSKGSDKNLKINTVEDVAMFKALYAMKNGDI